MTTHWNYEIPNPFTENEMKETNEPSKGIAGTVASIIAIIGTIEAAFPGRVPVLGTIIQAAPIAQQIIPLAMAVLGTLYAAASSAVNPLRRLIPWKRHRRA